MEALKKHEVEGKPFRWVFTPTTSLGSLSDLTTADEVFVNNYLTQKRIHDMFDVAGGILATSEGADLYFVG